MGSTITGAGSVEASRALMVARAQNRRAAASGGIARMELDSTAFMTSLAAHLAQLVVSSEDALVRTGYRVLSTARGLCPVDTGRLRASIILTKGRDGQGFYVEVGTNVYYARFVEFGTRYTRAQPFLLPAVALATGYLRSEAA